MFNIYSNWYDFHCFTSDVVLLSVFVPLALCGTYIDLCDEYGSYCCFAEEEGGPEPGFWFVESYDDQSNHRVNCELDSPNSR